MTLFVPILYLMILGEPRVVVGSEPVPLTVCAATLLVLVDGLSPNAALSGVSCIAIKADPA